MSDGTADEFRLEYYKDPNPTCPKCGMYNCHGDCDVVAHPAHYTTGKIECIEYINDKGLNFNLGNAVKYITRCNHKGKKREDLLKAKQYIDFELKYNCD